jgi:hypothetical protein
VFAISSRIRQHLEIVDQLPELGGPDAGAGLG